MNPRENKYVVVEVMGMETPIILPSYMNHCDVVKDQKVISAGICRIGIYSGMLSVTCFGDSFTLKVPSRGEIDSKLIEFFLESKS